MIWDVKDITGQVEIPIRESRSKSASSNVDVKSFKDSNASSFYEWTRDRDEVTLDGRLHKDSQNNDDSLQKQTEDILDLVGNTYTAFDPTKGLDVDFVVSDASVSVDTDVGTREASLDVVIVEKDASAFFEVQNLSTNSPVTEGEDLNVNFGVKNTGDARDTQKVVLKVGGSDRDSDTYVIYPGDVVGDTFTWKTQVGDAGSYTAAVQSDDDIDSTSVTIESA